MYFDYIFNLSQCLGKILESQSILGEFCTSMDKEIFFSILYILVVIC